MILKIFSLPVLILVITLGFSKEVLAQEDSDAATDSADSKQIPPQESPTTDSQTESQTTDYESLPTESLDSVNNRIDFFSDEMRRMNRELENLGQAQVSQNETLRKIIDDLVGEIESLKVMFKNLQKEVSEIKQQTTTSAEQTPSQTIPTPSSDLDPKQLYNQAYKLLTNKDFNKAREKMEEFLRLHPEHELSDNASYWIGETYFAEKNYQRASEVFSQAFERYPEGNKAPDNLLKLSISLIRLEQKQEACVTLNAMIEKYQNIPKHIKDRAIGEIKKLPCPS